MAKKEVSASWTSFNTIKSITYLVKGSPYTKAIAFYGFTRGIATERGYILELADCTVFLPERLLRDSKRRGADAPLVLEEEKDDGSKG